MFLDTSVLIAGVASATGAAASVLDLCETGVVEAIVSKQVLVEADRNFQDKFPDLIQDYRQFVRNVSPLLQPDPRPSEVQAAARIIDVKDAPILAAAINANPDFLFTWDTRHFQSKQVESRVVFRVVTPGELLEELRRLEAI